MSMEHGITMLTLACMSLHYVYTALLLAQMFIDLRCTIVLRPCTPVHQCHCTVLYYYWIWH